MTKVLITGSSGLVGKSIQDLITKSLELNLKFIFITSSDCDLRDEKSVDNIFNKIKPDIVVHLAARVGGLYCNMNSNYKMLVDNLKININILEYCKKYKIKRLINILSTCVFGNDLNYPLPSNQMYDKPPDKSNEGYSKSKRILDTGSRLLSDETDIEIVNLIPTNIYGKNDNYNLYDSHVIPGLIAKTYISKKDNSELIIKGDGNSFRQFIFADDFAIIILHFVNCKLNNKFNQLIVGPSFKNQVTITQLVCQIVKIFDFKGKVIYDKTSSNGQRKKTVDSNELLQYMPNFEFTPLLCGLKDTIDYYIDNYDYVRK